MTPEDASHLAAAERLTFFSDAVVAIAITLLAIDLPVPEGSTTAELFASMAADGVDHLAFLISFVVIANHWRAHHRVLRHLTRSDGPVVPLTFAWLLLVVLTPFLTRVLSEGEIVFGRFALYAAAQALQLVVFAVLVAVVARRGWLGPAAPPSVARRGWARPLVVASGFLVSIPLFPLMGSWAFALWAVVPLVLGRVLRRTGVVTPD